MRVTVHRRIFIGIMTVVIGFVIAVNIMIFMLFEKIAYQEVLRQLQHSVLSYQRFNERHRDLLITQARAMAETAHLKATLSIPDVDHETVQVAAESLRNIADPDILLVIDGSGKLLSNANIANQLYHPFLKHKDVSQALSGQFVSGMWSTNSGVYLVAVVPSAIDDLIFGAILVAYRLDKFEAIQELQDVTGSFVQVDRSDGSKKTNGHEITQNIAIDGKLISTVENVQFFELSDQSGMWLVANIKVPESESSLMLYKELDAVASIINPIKIAVAVGSLITILISLFVTNQVSSKISNPISNLTRAASRFGKGEFSTRVSIESNDEIGILADGFNEMISQIQIRDTELRESEKRLSEAQRIACLGHWAWNFSSDSTYFSDQIEVIFGSKISKELSIREVLLGFIHDDDKERVQHIIDNALLHKKGFEIEYKIVQPVGGEERILHQQVKTEFDNDGKAIGMIGTIQDITDLQNAEYHRYLAFYDSVTNLPNRAYLREHIEKALVDAKQNNNLIAIIFLDLDRFKRVNDNFGHSVGDELLKAVGQRLKNCVRSTDVVSHEPHTDLRDPMHLSQSNTLVRFGGDEFVIVVNDLNSIEEANDVPQRILDSLSNDFMIDGHRINTGASLGVSIYPVHGEDMETLLIHADLAMYKSKERGRQSYSIYTGSMNANTYEKYVLEEDLRKALKQNEFVLHYQPRINLIDEQIVGTEALIRWHHPNHGLVSPIEFIPLAEESGLIVTIGEWVLHTACAQTKAWQQAGLSTLCAAVNVSAKQLSEATFIEMIDKTLKDTGLNPQYLELEITEGMLMEDIEHSADLLKKLKNIGVKIALDDFGTGYSSLSYLNRLPFDTLKIDRSFTKNIPLDDRSSSLTAGIIALSHSLNIRVVAEGVETLQQLDFMRAHECDEIQGYYYSMPLQVDDFNQQYFHQLASVTQLHAVQK